MLNKRVTVHRIQQLHVYSLLRKTQIHNICTLYFGVIMFCISKCCTCTFQESFVLNTTCMYVYLEYKPYRCSKYYLQHVVSSCTHLSGIGLGTALDHNKYNGDTAYNTGTVLVNTYIQFDNNYLFISLTHVNRPYINHVRTKVQTCRKHTCNYE